MAQVTYSNADKYRYVNSEDQPLEKEETIRDKLIHKLINKQLNTQVDISKAKDSKSFVKSSVQTPITERFKGLLSLNEFLEARNESEKIELLKSCDLTCSEIEVLVNNAPINSSDEFLLAKLNAIDEKLSKKQKQLDNSDNSNVEKFSNSVPLSRHEYEEECIKVPLSNVADQLTKCLVHVEPDLNPLYASDHPIHQLPALAQELFPPTTHKSRKRKRKIKPPTKIPAENEGTLEIQVSTDSLWDVRQVPDSSNPRQKIKIGCAPKPFVYNIIPESRKPDPSKPFVLSLNSHDLKNRDEIRLNCASTATINKQFPNYEPGVQSPVLYIKNLPFSLTPKVLASIFGNFEYPNEPKITYRLLKGKMRGKAFLTFCNRSIANEALLLCNGYIIENKPMIISFGKQNM